MSVHERGDTGAEMAQSRHGLEDISNTRILFHLISFHFVFLGLHLRHREVPRLRVETDGTLTLMDTSWVRFHCAKKGIPLISLCVRFCFVFIFRT